MSSIEEIELGEGTRNDVTGKRIIEAEGHETIKSTAPLKSSWKKLKNLVDNWSYSGRTIFTKARPVPLWLKWALLGLSATAYCVYFVAVIMIHSKLEAENYWCDGDGFLIVVTCIVSIGIFYFQVVKNSILSRIVKSSSYKTLSSYSQKKLFRRLAYFTVIFAFVTFVLIDTKDDIERLTSAFGILAILTLSCLFSTAPRQIQFNLVVWGMGLQFTFALLILRTSVGQGTFQCLGDKFTTFLNFTSSGATFAFGPLGTDIRAYVFSILTVILFFGMVVSILYFYGILQWIILKLGWLLEATMGTTPCESIATASNIFLGTSEAPLVILPYIQKLTKSELHAVMTGGFATIAGSILSAYVSFGIKASHLMSASIMSAPAAMAVSKIIYPETEVSNTNIKNIEVHKGEEKSVLHAIMTGLSTALILMGSITATLLSFIAFVSFMNASMDWFCQLLDYEQDTCSFQGLFGIFLSPVVWLLGVPIEDCKTVGYLLGIRIMLTEFYSYKELGTLYKAGLISERAAVISTYAFCGFANVANLGGTMAALGSMAPTRRGDIAKLLVSALFAANMACLLTAAVAGTLLTDSTITAVDFNSTSFS